MLKKYASKCSTAEARPGEHNNGQGYNETPMHDNGIGIELAGMEGVRAQKKGGNAGLSGTAARWTKSSRHGKFADASRAATSKLLHASEPKRVFIAHRCGDGWRN
eukprot:28031-Pelagomonas_calceolata.AAC.3